ncbi:hypothetical protein PvtlMGM2_2146 [Prevotella sp. MGM2]|nr:hypothetical protein PvtlMGM2_2146 [Prevotella sp. MGM2]
MYFNVCFFNKSTVVFAILAWQNKHDVAPVCDIIAQIKSLVIRFILEINHGDGTIKPSPWEILIEE